MLMIIIIKCILLKTFDILVIKEWLFDYDFFSSVMETLRPTTGKTIMGIKRPMYTTLLMLVVTDGVRG